MNAAEIHAYTTAVLRARHAYRADENVRNGVCATCESTPIYKRARNCRKCAKERKQ